jgi:hypothetical protein
MKLPPALFVLAFLLGVASIAVFETVLSYQALNCSNQQQTHGANTPSDAKPTAAQKADDGGHEKKNNAVSEPFVCGIAGFPAAVRQFMNHNEGFVVGTFTFLLVFVTAWLVWATIKLWRGAEDTAQRQLRAYVVVTYAEPRFDASGDLVAALTFTNCGQTPAYSVSVSRGIKLLNREKPQFPEPNPGTSKFTLACGQPMQVEATLRGVAGVADMEEGDHFDEYRAIYVFGEATYRDIFRKPRSLPYRLLVMRRKDGSFGITPADEGNSPND